MENGNNTVNINENKKKKKLIAMITGAVLLVGIAIGLFFYFDAITAITMRIQRLVGDVNLYADGQEQTIREKMRLGAGQTVTTGGQSLIMVSLDDTKLMTMEESSRADIKARGKKLEFDLLEGNLFFNVTEKLADNEEFNVNTSTMVCGIRGTSAYVGRDSTSHEVLMVTDGLVHVLATNPVTKEQTEVDVPAGQMITIYLDEEAEGNKTISIKMRSFREEDLPAMALDTIMKSNELKDRIARASGFSAKKLTALAELSSVKGISMFGSAADVLRTDGIEDAIPFMGERSSEMVTSANSAVDIAKEDLPLEVAIITGYRDVMDTGIENGFTGESLSQLMSGTRECMEEVCIQATEAGASNLDILDVVATVTDTINVSTDEMARSDLSSDEIKDVLAATTELFTDAIAGMNDPEGTDSPVALQGVKNSVEAIQKTKEYVIATVDEEMKKSSNGEETVIALLGRTSRKNTEKEKVIAKKEKEEEKKTEDKTVAVIKDEKTDKPIVVVDSTGRGRNENKSVASNNNNTSPKSAAASNAGTLNGPGTGSGPGSGSSGGDQGSGSSSDSSGSGSDSGSKGDTPTPTPTPTGTTTPTATPTATPTPTPTPVPVSSVSLNITNKNDLQTGDSFKLTATVSPSNAKDKSVEWESSNPQIASVSGSGSSATVTGNNAGNAVITVKTKSGGKTATCNVKVVDPTIPVKSVSLDVTTKNDLKTGKTFTLTATIAPSNATDKEVVWSSSDDTVASVQGNGLTAEVTGVSAGNATITVTTKDGGKTADCAVTVLAPTSSNINKNAFTTFVNSISGTVSFAKSSAAPSTGTTTTDIKASGESVYVWVDNGNLYWYSDADDVYLPQDSSGMFRSNCYSSIDLTGLDSSNTTNMKELFSGSQNVASINMSGLDTSNVSNMSMMFQGCSSLTSLTLGSGFNTGQVTTMSYMFSGCSSFTSINFLADRDLTKVSSMGNMFYGCTNATEISLNLNASCSSSIDGSEMFSGCSSLQTIYVGSNFPDGRFTAYYTSGRPFDGCNALTGGAGSSGFGSGSSATDMRIDGGPGSEGAFTAN